MQLELTEDELKFISVSIEEMLKRINEMRQTHGWNFDKEIEAYKNINEKIKGDLESLGFLPPPSNNIVDNSLAVDKIETEEEDLEFLDSLCEDGLMP